MPPRRLRCLNGCSTGRGTIRSCDLVGGKMPLEADFEGVEIHVFFSASCLWFKIQTLSFQLQPLCSQRCSSLWNHGSK